MYIRSTKAWSSWPCRDAVWKLPLLAAFHTGGCLEGKTNILVKTFVTSNNNERLPLPFCLFFVCVCVCVTELRSVQESEELLVNVAATINNLSFYQEQSSVLRHSQLAITKRKTERVAQCDVEMKNKNDESMLLHPSLTAQILSFLCSICISTPVMLKLVLSSSMDSMLEATRVYGNMSKSKDVRDFIMQNKGIFWTQTQTDSHEKKTPTLCYTCVMFFLSLPSIQSLISFKRIYIMHM